MWYSFFSQCVGPDGIAIPRAHTPRDHVQIEFRKQQKLIRRSVRLPAQEKKWLSHIPTYPLSFWALVGGAHSTEPLTDFKTNRSSPICRFGYSRSTVPIIRCITYHGNACIRFHICLMYVCMYGCMEMTHAKLTERKGISEERRPSPLRKLRWVDRSGRDGFRFPPKVPTWYPTSPFFPAKGPILAGPASNDSLPRVLRLRQVYPALGCMLARSFAESDCASHTFPCTKR